MFVSFASFLHLKALTSGRFSEEHFKCCRAQGSIKAPKIATNFQSISWIFQVFTIFGIASSCRASWPMPSIRGKVCHVLFVTIELSIWVFQTGSSLHSKINLHHSNQFPLVLISPMIMITLCSADKVEYFFIPVTIPRHNMVHQCNKVAHPNHF